MKAKKLLQTFLTNSVQNLKFITDFVYSLFPLIELTDMFVEEQSWVSLKEVQLNENGILMKMLFHPLPCEDVINICV